MKEIYLEELKSVQLAMLQDVAAFCDEHNITYFLAFGTLIGAIRHKGYIPWDDDIDIAMPRPDYDRFISSFNDKESIYKVVSMENDNHYGLAFAKVHDTRTVLHETQYKRDVYGVYIDVFPIVGVKDKKQIKRLRAVNLMLHTKKANFKERTLSKKIINFFGKILLLPFSVHYIVTVIDRMARKYPFGSTPSAGNICDTVVGERAMIETSAFEGVLMQEFEGREYKIPIGYDKWLRKIYGDYMQLPPVEKRINHHIFDAWWKE